MTHEQKLRIREIRESIRKGKFGTSSGLHKLLEELGTLGVPKHMMEVLYPYFYLLSSAVDNLAITNTVICNKLDEISKDDISVS